MRPSSCSCSCSGLRCRVVVTLVALVALVCGLAGAAAEPALAATRSYTGTVGGFGETKRDRVQGMYHALRFRVRPARRLGYRVCLYGPTQRCWTRRTSSRGHSSINVSLWLNDWGGPGRWVARWYVGGRKVAVRGFLLRSEGV